MMIVRVKAVVLSPEKKEHEVLPKELTDAYVAYCCRYNEGWIPVGKSLGKLPGMPEYYPENMFTSDELESMEFLIDGENEVVRVRRIYDAIRGGWVWDDGFNLYVESDAWMIAYMTK